MAIGYHGLKVSLGGPKIKELASKNRNLRDLNLDVSSLYLLAAPSTPHEVRLRAR
jgi:hypothetical protein